LILYFFPFFGMAIWAYGSAVPSGLFVPTLLSGAALGRLFGHLLHVMDGANGREGGREGGRGEGRQSRLCTRLMEETRGQKRGEDARAGTLSCLRAFSR